MNPYASSLFASLCFYISGIIALKSGNGMLSFVFVCLGCVFFLLSRKKRKGK